MKEIAEKLQQLEHELSAQKGRFLLFALFLRENAPGVWDLVVAAPWIDEDETGAISEIAAKTQQILKREEIVKLSRIVTIETKNPGLRAVQQAISLEHGLAELHDSTFFGLPIEHAYIITSQKDSQVAPATAPECATLP